MVGGGVKFGVRLKAGVGLRLALGGVGVVAGAALQTGDIIEKLALKSPAVSEMERLLLVGKTV